MTARSTRPRCTGRALVVVALAGMLTACPDATPPPTASATPTLAPIRGGTLTLLVAEDLDALDPHLAATLASWSVARALHRGLYAYPDVAGRIGTVPVPDLAASEPVIDEGGRGARIVLSPVHRFSTGARITAADVVASLHRLARADRGIGPAVKAGLSDVVEVDEGILHLTSRGPIERLIDLLAHPQAAILPASTLALRKVRAPIGAGPYTLLTTAIDGYALRRRKDVPFDPVRPAHVAAIEVRIGTVRTVVPSALVLDAGPPDLVDPASTAGGRIARVSTGCVRYLDLSGSTVAKRARAQIVGRLRKLPDAGTGPVAVASVPPLLQTTPIARATPKPTPGPPPFDVVTSTSPRDRAEAAALRSVLPRVRVRTVAPGVLYGGAPVPAGARIRTWCADWPDALAIRRSPAGAATAVPLWWPIERVRLGARIRGFTGSVMFPRGDPTSAWLAPA